MTEEQKRLASIHGTMEVLESLITGLIIKDLETGSPEERIEKQSLLKEKLDGIVKRNEMDSESDWGKLASSSAIQTTYRISAKIRRLTDPNVGMTFLGD